MRFDYSFWKTWTGGPCFQQQHHGAALVRAGGQYPNLNNKVNKQIHGFSTTVITAGTPWQPEFGGWAFNLKRGEECVQKWNLIPRDTDVLVTHRYSRGHEEAKVLELSKKFLLVLPTCAFTHENLLRHKAKRVIQ